MRDLLQTISAMEVLWAICVAMGLAFWFGVWEGEGAFLIGGGVAGLCREIYIRRHYRRVA